MKQVSGLIAVILLLSFSAALAAADDVVIRLKTGATWRGDSADTVQIGFRHNGVPIELEAQIEKIEDLYIVVHDLSTKRNWTIFRADITSLSTVKNVVATGEDGARANDKNDTSEASSKSDAYSDKSVGVFVLPLNGVVGAAFRHDEIDLIAEEADKYGHGQIIVLKINSGGGLASEMLKISETIVEIKKRHRVVAWVNEAISAAAATAINCDEIYFQTSGNLGAITMHAGGQAVNPLLQIENVEDLRKMMAFGGRPEFLADAMVLALAEVSYDVDPVTGEVTWRQDDDGDFVLATNRQNLVLNSSQAVHSKFADGIADTNEELGELLGLPKWHEKSRLGYELIEDLEKLCKRGDREIPLLMARMNYAGQGSGNPITVLQKRIDTLVQLMRWIDRHESLCKTHNLAPKEVLQELVDEFREEIKRLRR